MEVAGCLWSIFTKLPWVIVLQSLAFYKVGLLRRFCQGFSRCRGRCPWAALLKAPGGPGAPLCVSRGLHSVTCSPRSARSPPAAVPALLPWRPLLLSPERMQSGGFVLRSWG